MHRRTIVTVFVAIALVTVAGLTTAAVGGGTAVEFLEGEDDQPPALLSFESAGAHCTDDVMANASTSVRSGAANTGVTYARNVSLPSPAHAIGGPTFERRNESTYLLSVPIEETSKPPRDCPGVARYNASMRIPAGDDPWRIVIQHDGTNVSTIFGDSDSSLTGGSSSAGGSASA